MREDNKIRPGRNKPRNTPASTERVAKNEFENVELAYCISRVVASFELIGDKYNGQMAKCQEIF